MIEKKCGHRILIGVAALLFFWGSGYCKPPVVQELDFSYNATVDRLLNREAHPFYQNNLFNDSTLVYGADHQLLYPRSFILNNLRCWSKMESDPVCQTTIFYKDSSTIVLSPIHPDWLHEDAPRLFIISRSKDISGPKEMAQYGDDELLNVLNSNGDDYSHIQIYKKEDLSRGNYIGLGMAYLFPPTALAFMLVEAIAVAPFTKRYSWGQVAGGTALVLAGFGGYELATWTDYTRIEVINIKF